MHAKSKYCVNKNMLRLVFSLALVLILATGCGGGADQPTAEVAEATQPPPVAASPVPTDTPAPSDTPMPTATTAPTDTPEPTDTPTPDLTATAAVEATQAAEEMMAKINPALELAGVSPEGGYLGWQQTEPVSIELDTYGEIVPMGFQEDFVAGDFVLGTTIIWESSSGFAGCGIMFRAEPDFEEGENYQFATIRLSGSPAWDIEYWNYGQWQSTLTNTIVTSQAIKEEQGSSNEYVLVAQGDQFTVYANGDRLGSSYHRKLTEGEFAFLAWHESGETTCTFENTWVWMVK